MFSTYFELGMRHIADLDAYDHMLFLLALIAPYRIIHLKKIVFLVTAFTIGHSLTLALATLDVVRIESAYVEFLIPITILITALGGLIRGGTSSNMTFQYTMTTFFGLIHGLGFSNYLRSLLGAESDLFLPLLGFNLGVEVGQIGIVLVLLLFETLVFQIFRFKHRDWILVISGGCVGIALVLMKDAAFW
jgi:hypothetical protein